MMDATPAGQPRRHLAGLNPERLLAQALTQPPASPRLPDLPGLEIGRCLGRGGMGAVYLARQTALARDVAVKLVFANPSRDPFMLTRLEREARVMARLRHPHLVTIHEFHQLEEGGGALIMEYIDGGDLRERLRRHPQGLPLDDALRWTREIALALAEAHAAGIIHRDLKPENILIDRAGAAHVADFGLALPLEQEADRLTLTGAAVGTADYLAPERFCGGEADARGDLYALGVLVYEMLIGQVPRGRFKAPQELRPEVPSSLSQVVMRALHPDPHERPASVSEFLAALNGPSRRAMGRPLAWVAAGALAATLAVGAWTTFHPPVAAPDPAGVPAKNDRSPSAVVSPSAVEDWRDAIAVADLAQGTISGGWSRENGRLVSNADVCILALAQEMPEAYDVRATFVRKTGRHSIAVFFRAAGGVGSVDIDGWDEHLAGVQSIDWRDLRDTGGFPSTLENGRRYQLLVEVRPTHVRVAIDEEEKGIFDIDNKHLGIVFPWAWDPRRQPAALAIGSYQSPTVFETVEWRRVDFF